MRIVTNCPKRLEPNPEMILRSMIYVIRLVGTNICEIIFSASDLGKLSPPRAFLTLLLAHENRDMRCAAIKVEPISLRQFQIVCAIGNLSFNASIQSQAGKL